MQSGESKWMLRSIGIRLQQIDWQLDLCRSDMPRVEGADEAVRLIYEAEGMISHALMALGARKRAGLPFPHSYQQRTPMLPLDKSDSQ